SSRRRHTRFDCDWSSDVCSSDLGRSRGGALRERRSGKKHRRHCYSKNGEYLTHLLLLSNRRQWVVDVVVGTTRPHACSTCCELRSEERRVGKECRSLV